MVDFKKENEVDGLISAARKAVADSSRASMSGAGTDRRTALQLGRWLHDARTELAVLRDEVQRMSQALDAAQTEVVRLKAQRVETQRVEDPKPRRIVCPSCDSGSQVVLSNAQPVLDNSGTQMGGRIWDAHCTGCGWRWAYCEDIDEPQAVQVLEAMDRPMPGEEEFGQGGEAGSGGES